MITLHKTCIACPEQYDAFDEDGEMVGYLRLRHGVFRVHYPNVGDTVVYEAKTIGDGCFDEDERETHLRLAVHAIECRLMVDKGRPLHIPYVLVDELEQPDD